MKLIICDTYSQILIAIQLKLTIFEKEIVDIRISDHSKGVEAVAEKLNNLELFRNVFFVKTKDFTYNRSKLLSIVDLYRFNFGKKEMVKIDLYDEIIYYNLNLFIYGIADYYEKSSHKCVWSRMEEGLFSYETDFESGFRVNSTRIIRKYINRVDVANLVKNYYCYFPQLKKANGWNFIKIPSITENIERYIEILNYVFEYQPKPIKEKYIYFASSSDIDGNPYGETDLILRLGKKLGDDLIVKVHPRDNRDIFANSNIKTMKASSVPWELVQMNLKDRDKIFLTVNSGAFVSITAILNSKSIKGFYLLDEITKKDDAFIKRENEIKNMIQLLHTNHLAANLKICNVEEISK